VNSVPLIDLISQLVSYLVSWLSPRAAFAILLHKQRSLSSLIYRPLSSVRSLAELCIIHVTVTKRADRVTDNYQRFKQQSYLCSSMLSHFLQRSYPYWRGAYHMALKRNFVSLISLSYAVHLS